MRFSRKALFAGTALAGVALLSPVWGFEVAYHYGIWGEELPQPGGATVPSMMQEALWVASGETSGAGIEMLWVGNYFQSATSGARPARGHAASEAVARRIVYRDTNRYLRGLEHHVRSAAVAVWLTRHVSEADLKQYLSDWIYFGRGAWGASAAARTYFGQPLDHLTIGQTALLAVLPQVPTRHEPMCHPEQVAKRRSTLLEQLRNAASISKAEYEIAAKEEIAVLPSAVRCRKTPSNP